MLDEPKSSASIAGLGKDPLSVAAAAESLLSPPTGADKEKTVVLEKLRRLAFKIVTDELKDPTYHKEAECDPPKTANEKRRDDKNDRNDDHGNAERMR